MTKESKKITLLALACVCCSSHALSTGAEILKHKSTRAAKIRLFALDEKQMPSDSSSTSATGVSTRRKNTRLQMAAATMAEPKRKTKKTTSSSTAKKDNDTDTRQKKAGAEALRSEMMNHEILTREQDLEYGGKIQRSNELKASMMQLIDDKEMERSTYRSSFRHPDFMDEEPINESLFSAAGSILEDTVADNWPGFSLTTPSEMGYGKPYPEEVEDEKFLFRRDHVQNRRQMPDSVNDDLDDTMLSDDDILYGLDLAGGRDELRRILMDGSLSRDALIRCNVKLVVSIAKKWARNTARMTNSDGGHKLAAIYAGSTTRPSLDEAIQEGIVGLARAADRFDAKREFRFSTYATYWITNQVRICFQRASTGSLRVPAPYHDIKTRYKKIIRRCVETNTPVPPDEELAVQVGVTLNRMRKALHYTRPLISLDAPLHAGMGASRGSNAGGDGVGERQILVSDLLACQERNPDEAVELSLLRQCLENAMASELSPHERDVIRLRLGLDDGVARSAREVVDVCGGSISIAEVRNAEKRAYRKMSSPFAMHTRQLLSYLDFAGGDMETIKE
jgi:RNA polymerase primary sigma factor